MMKKLKNNLFTLVLALLCAQVQAERIPVSQFESGWEQESFVGKTQYKLVNKEGAIVLKASSNAAASGLFKKIRIDLEKTPYLNWSWQIERGLHTADAAFYRELFFSSD